MSSNSSTETERVFRAIGTVSLAIGIILFFFVSIGVLGYQSSGLELRELITRIGNINILAIIFTVQGIILLIAGRLSSL